MPAVLYRSMYLLLVQPRTYKAEGPLPDGLQAAVTRVDSERVVHDGVGRACGRLIIRAFVAILHASLARVALRAPLLLQGRRRRRRSTIAVAVLAVSAPHGFGSAPTC